MRIDQGNVADFRVQVLGKSVVEHESPARSFLRSAVVASITATSVRKHEQSSVPLVEAIADLLKAQLNMKLIRQSSLRSPDGLQIAGFLLARHQDKTGNFPLLIIKGKSPVFNHAQN